MLCFLKNLWRLEPIPQTSWIGVFSKILSKLFLLISYTPKVSVWRFFLIWLFAISLAILDKVFVFETPIETSIPISSLISFLIWTASSSGVFLWQFRQPFISKKLHLLNIVQQMAWNRIIFSLFFLKFQNIF